MYSSIPVRDRIAVIKKCYWPLLNLIEKGIPLGIQITGVTLEIINKLDPGWIKNLKQYLSKEKCELIGGGYSQIIAPLVPAEVNHYNQVIGLETYREILNIRPKIASISEMAYSAGIVEHYINNGYKAILMEWNNPKSYHSEWNNEWQYYPQRAAGRKGDKIPVIWINSIAFQKFQRYVYGECSFDEYINYISDNLGPTPRYFPLYANDSEIFNYRPGRYKTEAKISHFQEWNRILNLFKILKRGKRFKLILPSIVLKASQTPKSANILHLESPAQPIPVKKQEKYNINRWALTGRGDLGINTKCYAIHKYFRKINNSDLKEWKELCYLWASDFRTHITDKRWQDYQRRLNALYKKWVRKKAKKIKEIKLQKIKLPYKSNDLKIKKEKQYLSIENKKLKIIFNCFKGLTIAGCWFKKISNKPLLGTLPHGYYENIFLGADFFSGHSIIEMPGKHKITDLDKSNISIFLKRKEKNIHLKLINKKAGVVFNNEIIVSGSIIIIKKRLKLSQRRIGIIRPIHYTFIPTSWDKQSLYFATHNGGSVTEKYFLAKNKIFHGEPVSLLVSAKHGLGATKGIVKIGDKEKEISIFHDQTISALIPSIYYVPMNNKQYFFRLQYSAQEIDETFKESNKGQKLEFCWKIAPNKNCL